MTALVANITIGAKAFSAAEASDGDDDTLSSPIFYAADKVCDGFLLYDGVIKLEDSEALALLLGLRASFELFTDAPPRKLQKVLSFSDSLARQVTETDRRLSLASSAYHILDFMECHVPERILLKWIEQRKNTSKEIMEEIAKDLEEMHG